MTRSQSKTTKINSIVARALAALGNEDDDEGGCGGNRRKTKEVQQQLDLDENDILPISGNQVVDHSHRLPILHHGSGVRGGTEMVEIAAEQNFVASTEEDDANILPIPIGVPGASERLNADDVATQTTTTLHRLPVVHHGKFDTAATSARDFARFNGDQYHHQNSRGDSSMMSEDGDELIGGGGDEIVRPHSRDVLPCFLSTPFDRGEMLALYRLKEGIEPVGRKRRRSIALDRLPISPQKHFIKKRKVEETGSNSTAVTGCDVGSSLIPEALQLGHKQQTSDPALINHCLIKQPHNSPSPQQQLASGEHSLRSPARQQSNDQSPAHHLQVQPRDISPKKPALDGLALHPSPQQTPLHLQLSPTMTTQQPAWRRMFPQPTTQRQLFQHLPSQQMLSQYYQGHLLNVFGRNHQQHLYPSHTIHAFNGSHYPQHSSVTAPVFIPGTGMQTCGRNNNEASTFSDDTSPTIQEPIPQSMVVDHSPSQGDIAENGQPKPSTAPILVIAGEEVKLDNSDQDRIAKLPLAFGFSLDDGGISKALALAATQNWYKNGKLATDITYDNKGIRRKGGGSTGAKKSTSKSKTSTKDGGKGGGKKYAKGDCGNPQDQKIMRKKMEKGVEQAGNKISTITANVSSNGSPNSTGTSPSGRAAATLISSSASPSGLPNGWTIKTFKRMSGKTSGTTDSYWYSPQLKYKFRSMRACKLYIEVLNEPGIDGDELVAFDEFKKRGFRL